MRPPLIDVLPASSRCLDGVRTRSTRWGGARATGTATLLTVVLTLAMLVGSGCDWNTLDRPETVRLRIEGVDGATVDLVATAQFLPSAVDGVEQDDDPLNDYVLLSADTVTVTVPFAREYDIRRDQRFLARVYRSDVDDGLVVRAFLDDRSIFNRTVTDAPQDSLVQFVYVFQSGGTNPGGNL